MEPTTYAFSQDLVQAIVSSLNEMPALRVRGLLNAIENECMKQDRARAQQAEDGLREKLKVELLEGKK